MKEGYMKSFDTVASGSYGSAYYTRLVHKSNGNVMVVWTYDDSQYVLKNGKRVKFWKWDDRGSMIFSSGRKNNCL